jgi:hypothetical protein
MIEYTDEQLDEFEELGELIELMSPEELKDFISSVEILGNAKKKGCLITNSGNYYN